jgi:hypothetical protein
VVNRTYTTVASGATSYRITFVGPASAAAGASFHFKVEAVDGGGNVDTGNSSTATLVPEIEARLPSASPISARPQRAFLS